MSVLRTESKTIPARTIQTAIIGISAGEWNSMRIKYFFAVGTYVVLTLGLIAGTMISVMLYAIDMTDFMMRIFSFSVTSAILTSAVTVSAVLLPLFYVLSRLYKYAESLEPNIAKKHGWNGKSRYRVDLEYQTFLHQ